MRPETNDLGVQYKYIVPTAEKMIQAAKVGAKDTGTGMTVLTGLVTRHEVDQELVRLERLVAGRRSIRRVVAKHELRTGFEVQTEDLFSGTMAKEPILWDHIDDRSRDEFGAAAHDYLERMAGAMRLAKVPVADDSDSLGSGAAGHAKGERSISGLWADGAGEGKSAERGVAALVPRRASAGESGEDHRPHKVLASVTTQSEDGRIVVVTLKVLLEMLSAESVAQVRRDIFNEAAKRSMLKTAVGIDRLRKARSMAVMPTAAASAAAAKATTDATGADGGPPRRQRGPPSLERPGARGPGPARDGRASPQQAPRRLKRMPTHAGQMWAVGEADEGHASDSSDGSSEASLDDGGESGPGSLDSDVQHPSVVEGAARRPFAAAQGSAVVPFGGGAGRTSAAPGAASLATDTDDVSAEDREVVVKLGTRRAGAKGAKLSAPWEARLARMFVLEEYDVGTRRLDSTAMAFDVLLARVKHPRLVQAAVRFMQSIGLRRGGDQQRVRRSSIMGLGAALGFEQGDLAADDYAFAGRPDSALGLLGHGKYSDWVPLARMSCKLGGRDVDVILRMRFRRTMFSAERARKLREERARASAAGGLPLPPNAFTSTHSLTRFVFEVTDRDSGALVMKQHANYSEMLASQKTGVADLADDVIAAMEMAEGLVQVRQLEYLEHLERSAAAQHEEGVRHVIPPSVIASRDEAARRIQEVVRRWRVRKRETAVAELVELLTASPHAREEMRVGLEAMHCTTIRQWITGVNPFSTSTSMMRAITAKRRAMGSRGRVFIDPVTGRRRVRHPTRPREPFDVAPEAPSAQVTEDVLAFLEEQVTMQALAGDSGDSRSAARGRAFDSPLARLTRSRSPSPTGPGTSGPGPTKSGRGRSPASRGGVNKGRRPGRGLGAELRSEGRAAGDGSAAPGAAAAFRPFAPDSPSIAGQAASGRASRVPLHEKAAVADVSGPDGPTSGAHASLRRDKIAAARTVEGMHDLVITSPRAGNEVDGPVDQRVKAIREDLGDLRLNPTTRTAQALHARAGLLSEDEAGSLRLPGDADAMADLPSSNPAHFMPVDPSRLDQWVGFLIDDDAYAALDKQWAFHEDNRRPDTPPPNLMEGKTIYDAAPTVAPLPSFGVGDEETRSRRRIEGLAGEERASHVRRREIDTALGGLALTIQASSTQAEQAAADMRRVRDRLSSSATEAAASRPLTAAQAAVRARTESMGTVLAYNETIRARAEEENLDVIQSGFNLESSLSAGGSMVRRQKGHGPVMSRADRLGMAQTIEISRRVREARQVVEEMRQEGTLAVQPTGDTAHAKAPAESRRPRTVGIRGASYSSLPGAAKARPRTSLAHAAGSVLYPVSDVVAAEAAAPRAVRGVNVDGVDTMGYSGEWASGRTRRNVGGRWVDKTSRGPRQ